MRFEVQWADGTLALLALGIGIGDMHKRPAFDGLTDVLNGWGMRDTGMGLWSMRTRCGAWGMGMVECLHVAVPLHIVQGATDGLTQGRSERCPQPFIQVIVGQQWGIVWNMLPVVGTCKQ